MEYLGRSFDANKKEHSLSLSAESYEWKRITRCGFCFYQQKEKCVVRESTSAVLWTQNPGLSRDAA